MAKRKRLPKDFNYTSVKDEEITNPESVDAAEAGTPKSTEYPKHLHKYAGLDEKGVMLPLEFVEVADAKAEARARSDGWGTAQEETAEGKKAEAEYKQAHGRKSEPKPITTGARSRKRAAKPSNPKPKAAKAPKAAETSA